METATPIQMFLGVILLFILPIVIAVVFPALIVSKIIKKIISKGKASLPSIWPFVFTITILAILANLLWNIFVFNKIYYNWDWLLLSRYTLLFHESPNLNEGPNWIAYGWETMHLDLLWIGITILICSISGLVTVWFSRKNINLIKYKRVIFLSTISIILLSILSETFLMNDKINLSCPINNSSGKKIMYQSLDGRNTFSISDLSAKNIQELRLGNGNLNAPLLSSDGSMYANFLDSRGLWVFCVNSKEQFRISLPEIYSSIKNGKLSSELNWSPDSKYIVFNRYGDLILVDIVKKVTKLLKHNVTPKIGYNPSNKEDRPEAGLAKWGIDGSVYYTSFEKEGGRVSLYKLIPQTNQNQLVTSSSNFIESVKISVNGKILLVSEHPWNTLNMNSWYIINTKTGRKSSINADSFSNLSPDGKYISVNYVALNTVPAKTSYPYILDTDSGAKLSIRDKVIQAFIQNNVAYIDPKDKTDLSSKNKLVDSIEMRIVDFVDNERILLDLTTHYSTDYSYRETVGIFSLKTNEFTILHNHVRENIVDIKLRPIEVIGK